MGGKKKWSKHSKGYAYTARVIQQLHTDYNGAYSGRWGPTNNDSAGSHGGRPTGTQPPERAFRKSCLTDTLWQNIVKHKPALGRWRNLLQAHCLAQERHHFSNLRVTALRCRAFSLGVRETWEKFLAAHFRRQVAEDIYNLLTSAMKYQTLSMLNCCHWARFTTYAARDKRRDFMVEQARADARKRLEENKLTLQ